MSKPVIPAVVLAGGKSSPEMVEATGVASRAMVRVRGRTMLEHVCGALEAAGAIGDVAVVGDVPIANGCHPIADHGDFVANLFAALEWAAGAPAVLVSTCDIPFITAAAFDDLVTRGTGLQADIVYPIVEVERCYERFPGVRRTSLRTGDGTFTGGNAMLLNARFLMAHRERIAEAFAARKSPARLAMMIGPGTIVRLAASQTVSPRFLRVAALERAVGRMLGGAVRSLVSEFPEIATDIDRMSDLRAIE